MGHSADCKKLNALNFATVAAMSTAIARPVIVEGSCEIVSHSDYFAANSISAALRPNWSCIACFSNLFSLSRPVKCPRLSVAVNSFKQVHRPAYPVVHARHHERYVKEWRIRRDKPVQQARRRAVEDSPHRAPGAASFTYSASRYDTLTCILAASTTPWVLHPWTSMGLP